MNKKWFKIVLKPTKLVNVMGVHIESRIEDFLKHKRIYLKTSKRVNSSINTNIEERFLLKLWNKQLVNIHNQDEHVVA